jgi:tetratricopeptide (TPR) repeat protein
MNKRVAGGGTTSGRKRLKTKAAPRAIEPHGPQKDLRPAQRWTPVLGAALILLMTAAAYVPAMRAGFVWDDNDYVTENPLLTAPDGFKRIWFSLDSPSQYFPLVYTTFRIEHGLWGFNPLGYHIVNIILHAINAVLVWMILRRLSVPGSWLAGAIFALHPVNVESVAWITERKNVVSTLFYLLAILAWMRFTSKSTVRPWRYYGLAIGAHALALFAKTTACSLPVALVLVLWLQEQKVDRRRWLQVTPFVAMGLAMGILSIWWEHNRIGTTGAEFALTYPQRVLIASRALWFYLGKLLWPAKLTFSYPRWTIDPANPAQYGWLVACLVAGATLYAYRKKLGRGPVVAAVWFAATLAPVLGFVSLYTFRYTFVADHYQYIAGIGPIALAAALISRKWKTPAFESAVRLPATMVILAILGALTWHQGKIYAGPETLWRDTLRKNPSSTLAHNNLGNILDRRGKYDEAIEHYRAALRSNPEFAEAHLNLGIALTDKGLLDQGIAEYYETIRLAPEFGAAYYNLGVALGKQGKIDEAIEAYSKAVYFDPEDAQAHNNLGVALVQVGRLDEAIYHYCEALKYLPELENIHNNLAAALYFKGYYADAWREIHLCRKYGGNPHPGLIEALSEKMREP